ncbi:MAG: DUF3854 domain-containing protein [bacterium]
MVNNNIDFTKINYIVEHWDDIGRPFVSGGKFDAIQDLKKSGLSVDAVSEAKLEFIGNSDDIKTAIGFSGIAGQSIIQACTVLKIPYFDQNGNEIYCRVRLYPPLEEKYYGQKGMPAIPYVHQKVWKIKDKKNVEIWIVEGEKKALKLIQEGEKAIAVGGVWNFKAGKDSIESGRDRELWQEIDEFLIPGRTVYIGFDTDFNKNSAVRQAMLHLSIVLFNKNVNVKITTWDSHFKGIDDYLTSENADIQAVKENATGILKFIELNPEYTQETLSCLHKIKLNDIVKSKLQAVFKKIGVLKKVFDKYEAFRDNTENNKQPLTENGFILPSRFAKANEKLCLVAENEMGVPFTIPICDFFNIEKIIKTDENTMLSLKFINRSIEIDAICIGDGRELCKEFNSKGIFIINMEAKTISSYLKKFIDANSSGKIKSISAHSKTCWTDANEFLAPTTTISNDIVFDSDITRKIVKKGSQEKQIEFLKNIFTNHAGVSIVICAGLASLLIKPLNLNNYVLFVSGRTGTGKTLANQIMLSLIGNPETLKNNMNTTQVGAEMLFSRFLDLPILLDELETSGLTSEKINNFLVNLIYSYQSGVGRTRSQKNLQLRETAIYRGILFLTSERSIKSVLSDNSSQKANLGVYRRVIEINDKTQLFANNVNYADIAGEINQNYGHILPLWTDYIRTNIDSIKADFSEIRKVKLENLGGKHEILSLFSLVNKYFREMIGINQNPDFNKILATIIDENAETFATEVKDEVPRYKNIIKEFALTSGLFINKISNEQDVKIIINKPAGQIEYNDECIIYYYTEKAFELLCKEYKLEQSRILEILKTAGILISKSAGSPFKQIKKINGNVVRCYYFCFEEKLES